MPAAKKTASTKRTNSNKKNQSFLRKLIPTTRKSKMITLIAAFVVIGGGLMVYRSFAGTATILTLPASELVHQQHGGNKLITESNGVQVVEGSRFYVDWSRTPIAKEKLKNFLAPHNGKKAEVCAYIRGLHPSAQAILYLDNMAVENNKGNGVGGFQSNTHQLSTEISTYCSGQFTVRTTTAEMIAISVFSAPEPAARVINIKVIIRDEPQPGKNPQPAPAPTPAPASTPQPSK